MLSPSGLKGRAYLLEDLGETVSMPEVTEEHCNSKLLEFIVMMGSRGKIFKEAPRNTKYFMPHVRLMVDLGDNHTAALIMDSAALDHLCSEY